MPRPLSPQERFQLLSAWCDGSITDAGLAQLDELLRTDPEFRKFYLAYMDQHALLAADLLAIADPLPWDQRLKLVERESPPGWPAAVPAPAARSEGDKDARESFAAGPRRASAPWRGWVAAGTALTAVAAVLLAGLTVWLWPKGGRENPVVSAPQPWPRPQPHLKPQPPATPQVTPQRLTPGDGLAVVIQLARVEWEPGVGIQPAEGDTLAVSRLAFRSGQITLGLLSGVTLTVEGPADLDLLALDRVHCRRGKLRTRVPDGAEGFVVSAPSSAVVDLGTEFGLNVAVDGRAQLMVFEGAAEAAVMNAAGSPLQIHQVVEHQAFAIDPHSGQIAAAAAHGEDFVRPPVLSVPALGLDPNYRDVVLAAQPWGFWRFETLEGNAVPNEIAGSPPLRANGPVRLAVDDGPNRCVEFGPDSTEQNLILDGLWQPPGDPGYAVELWVLPERIGHAALASLIEPGPPSSGDYKHLFLLELTASDRQSLLPPAAVRFLHRWPPGDSGGENLFSSRYYIPYRWHHLVAQNNAGLMELYMDGVPAPSLSIRSGLATEACRFLVGRLKPEPRPSGKVHSRPFVGRIDELALYNRPLSVAEIERHARRGAPGDTSTEP